MMPYVSTITGNGIVDFILCWILPIALGAGIVFGSRKYGGLVSTWFHENGHALTAVLTGGYAASMELNHSDTTNQTGYHGVVYSGSRNPFAAFLVSMNGYISAITYSTIIIVCCWFGWIEVACLFLTIIAVLSSLIVNNFDGYMLVTLYICLVALAWISGVFAPVVLMLIAAVALIGGIRTYISLLTIMTSPSNKQGGSDMHSLYDRFPALSPRGWAIVNVVACLIGVVVIVWLGIHIDTKAYCGYLPICG